MKQDELLQKYRKNNIEMAHALNEKKVAINSLTEDVLNLQSALQNANKMRSTLEFELNLRTIENKQLREQLNDRDHKLATWRALMIDLFKSSTSKYMEVMQAIGIAPIPRAAEAPTLNQDQKSNSMRHANVNLLNISPSSERPLEKGDNFTDFVGQRSDDQSSGVTTSNTRTQQNQGEDDLIRFSKSPKNQMEKIEISSGVLQNVTVRRPTTSLPIDKNRYPDEDPDLITQINESLELLEELSHPSVLYPKTEILKSEGETTFSDDSIQESFSLMKISKDSGSKKLAKQSSDEPKIKEPIESSKTATVEKTNENEASSSMVGSTTPTIQISKCPNVLAAIKRKSDESRLRIPKNFAATGMKLQPSSPKKAKLLQSNAFNAKSPQLSSASSSPITSNKRSSTNLSKIAEKSPAKSPMKSTSNNNNMNKNTAPSGNQIAKSLTTSPEKNKPQESPTKKKLKENKPNDATISGKKHSSKNKSVGIRIGDGIGQNDLIGPNGRRLRHVAPADYREPSLILKMRRGT